MQIYEDFKKQVTSTLNSLCEEFFSAGDQELRDMYYYAVSSGRKYRPSLILTGKLMGDSSFNALTIRHAVVVELIHKYSLILDDSVDNDPLRRGVPTFYQKFGRNNAQAMSAYLMSLLFREYGKIRKDYRDDQRLDSISSLYEEILSDMSVGFISDLNSVSRDIHGIRKISDMQTSTLLRNSLLIGFLTSDYYQSGDYSFLYKTLYELGNYMGTIFQAYNDIEIFCGKKFQSANKGHFFPDFVDNRKNIILAKVPPKIINARDTNGLVEYINNNHLFEDVFTEIFDILKTIKLKISYLPPNSIGTQFLVNFVKEKDAVIKKLSKADIFEYEDTRMISAM